MLELRVQTAFSLLYVVLFHLGCLFGM